jgi:hypothetical protein
MVVDVAIMVVRHVCRALSMHEVHCCSLHVVEGVALFLQALCSMCSATHACFTESLQLCGSRPGFVGTVAVLCCLMVLCMQAYESLRCLAL